MKKLVSLILGLVLIAGAASAQDISEQESRKARLEQEIEILENQIKAAGKKSSNALSSLSLLQKKVSTRKALLKESEREIRVINDSLYAKQRQINRIQERLDTMTLYYGRLIRNAYKNRDARIWYMYILASDNLGQASRRYSYLRSLSSQMKIQAQKIRESKEELEAQKSSLLAMKKRAQQLRDSRAAELKTLQKEESQSKTLVSQLRNNQKKYQQQLDSKRRQVESLNREINRIISSAMSSKGKEAVDYKLAGEFEANKGKLPWPADGPVVEHFGQHNHPVYTRVKMPFNNGVNIALSPGTVAKAVFDGKVKQVIVMPGYGQCVLVQHGSYFTFYCKLTGIKVKAGQTVSVGQALGTVDTISSETQLHFQLWKGKSPQDPELWLRRR